jgi:hypothetical protein
LFYGPERIEGLPPRVHCVFNVKKRSWKGGIQVVVEVDDSLVGLARKTIGLDDWASSTVQALPKEDRPPEDRILELFTQAVCAIKLDLAIEAGLPQENVTIEADAFASELARALPDQTHRILQYLREELDLS